MGASFCAHHASHGVDVPNCNNERFQATIYPDHLGIFVTTATGLSPDVYDLLVSMSDQDVWDSASETTPPVFVD